MRLFGKSILSDQIQFRDLMMGMRREHGRPIIIKDRSKRLLSRSAQQDLLGHMSAYSAAAAQSVAERRTEGVQEVDWSKWVSRDVNRQGHLALIRLAFANKLDAFRSTWSATPEEQDAALGRQDDENDSDDREE